MHEDLYCNGENINYKNICLKTPTGEVYVHKPFLTTYFEYFGGLFEWELAESSTDQTNIFVIDVNKPKIVVNILMRCLYQLDIKKEIVSLEDKWDTLLDVLDLYDFWSPKNNFEKIFKDSYEEHIMHVIYQNHPNSPYQALIKLEGKQLKCIAELRIKLIRNYEPGIIKQIGLQALQKHKLKTTQRYCISNFSPQTLDIIYNYFFIEKRLTINNWD